MKKRIILFCTALTFAALAISGVIALLAVQQRYLKEARSFLNGSMEALMADSSGGDYNAFAQKKAAELQNGVRITFIDTSGKVLGDSEADYREMPNHAGRAEVAEALQTGTGEEVRHSDTVGMDMLYVAKKYGNVIARFAIPLKNEQIFTMDILPSIIVAIILALIAAVVAVNLLTKRILSPFYELKKVLAEVLGGKRTKIPESEYAELAPVVDGLNEMAGRIDSYVKSIKQQTEKIDNIIRYMQEGMILLDEDMHVLLSNDSARTLFGLESELNGKSFLHLVRNKDVISSLHTAVNEQKPVALDIKKKLPDMRSLRILISPVQKGAGAILLVSDITEITRAENVRREFTANVSHELKTPLTTIKGFAELMSEGMVRDEKAINKYAKLILFEVERLINLINDILRISELEETAIPVSLEEVDLKEVAEDVAALMSEEANKRGIRMSLKGENVKISAVRDGIKQLVLNLVDNAIKYNRENGSVEITTGIKGGKACIAVEDTGIGIPKEHQQRIFERFYRVDKARSKKTGGTGLGLSIVKHITELYKGAIKLESEIDEGTKFTILFPIAR
jgi:two-component system phosphate regulon sensor histidine kinase PhoR